MQLKQQFDTFKYWKKEIFFYTQNLLRNQFSILFYNILLIIQALQILGYLFALPIQYSTIGLTQFSWVTRILNPQTFLRLNVNTIYILVPIMTSISLAQLMLILITISKHFQSQVRRQAYKNRITYPLNIFFIVYNTILTIPICASSIVTLYCHQGSIYHKGRQCFDNKHIVLCIMSFINLVWLIGNIIYFSLFYLIKNPLSKSMFGVSSNYWNFAKFVVKIAPIFFLVFDQNLQFKLLYRIGLAGLLIGYIFIFRYVFPYYHFCVVIAEIVLAIQIFLTIIVILLIPQHFFYDPQKFNIGFIYSFIIAIIFSIISVKIVQYRKNKLRLFVKQQVNKQNLGICQELYCYLLTILENHKKENKPMAIYHIVKIHQEKCENIECSCHEFIKEMKNKSNEYIYNYALGFKVYADILAQIIRNNQQAYYFTILRSYTLYYCIPYKIRSIYQLSRLFKSKLPFLDQYFALSLLYQFQNIDFIQNQMDIYIDFDTKFTELEYQSENLVIYFQQYWLQFSYQQTHIGKLWSLIKQIIQSQNKIFILIKQLQKLYPKSITVLTFASLIFKYIIHDQKQYKRIRQTIKQISFELRGEENQSEQITFKDNSELTVLTIHMTPQCLPQITSCTSNIQKLLGYSRDELIGSSLNKILPKIYYNFHNPTVKKYFQRCDYNILTRQLVIFPLNNQGYIVKCKLISKIIPSFQYGFEIITFLNKCYKINMNNYILIYHQQTGIIDSMTVDCQKLFNKSIKNNNGAINDINHISDLLPEWDYLSQKFIGNINNTSSFKRYQYGSIKLFRSDGPTNNKYIKILQIQQIQQIFEIQNITMKIIGNKLQQYNKDQISLVTCSIVKQQSQFQNLINPSLTIINLLYISIMILLLILIILGNIFVISQQRILSQKIIQYTDINNLLIKAEYTIIQISQILSTILINHNNTQKILICYHDLALIQNLTLQISHNKQFIDPNYNYNIKLFYLIDGIEKMRQQPYYDGIFQLIAYSNRIILEIQKNILISTEAIYYITNNSIVLANFYRKLSNRMTQNMNYYLQNHRSLLNIQIGVKTLSFFFIVIILTIYIFIKLNHINSIIKFYQKIKCVNFKDFVTDCKIFKKEIFSKDKKKVDKKISKYKKILNLQLQLNNPQPQNISSKQSQELQLLQPKVIFQGKTSKYHYIRNIIIFIILYILLQSIFIIVFLSIHENTIFEINKSDRINSLKNSLMTITYFSSDNSNNLTFWSDKIIQEIQNCEKILQYRDELIFNNISKIYAKLQSLRFIISSHSNFTSLRQFQQIIFGIIYDLRDNASLQLQKSIVYQSNYRSTNINIFFTVQILFIIIIVKIIIIRFYKDLNEKTKKSDFMVTILSENLQKQYLNYINKQNV